MRTLGLTGEGRRALLAERPARNRPCPTTFSIPKRGKTSKEVHLEGHDPRNEGS